MDGHRGSDRKADRSRRSDAAAGRRRIAAGLACVAEERQRDRGSMNGRQRRIVEHKADRETAWRMCDPWRTRCLLARMEPRATRHKIWEGCVFGIRAEKGTRNDGTAAAATAAATAGENSARAARGDGCWSGRSHPGRCSHAHTGWACCCPETRKQLLGKDLIATRGRGLNAERRSQLVLC